MRTQTEPYFSQTAYVSGLVIGTRRLHDAAVCKTNPRGHKKLLCLRRIPMSASMHCVIESYSKLHFSCGRQVFSTSLTCYLQHWPRRVSPLNEWQLRHNTHQRWHMKVFPFQLGHPEIKRDKSK